MDKAQQKSLKLAYKLALPPMGIFAIRNTATGKVFLDKSSNLSGSINRHRMELKLGSHRNAALLADWRVYGEDKFAFEILEQIKQSTEPDYDYAEELNRLLANWRANYPLGAEKSYR